MPAYDYACRECGHRFELRQKMSDAPAETCPACGGGVKRLLTAGAGVVVRGAAAAMPSPCGSGGCCAPQMREACGCDH